MIVLDDETYVYGRPDLIPGREFFSAVDRTTVPIEFRLKKSKKFPEKYMIWQAIDEDGNVTEPYICKGTLTSEKYLQHCIKPILIPFIKQHHNLCDVLFWPDLATPHYGKIVQAELRAQGIAYVPKEINPPNVPSARPIEIFWAIMKQWFKKHGKEPTGAAGLKRIWKNLNKKFAKDDVRELMKLCRKNLRAIAYDGVYATYTK